jgi:hypothetical protein
MFTPDAVEALTMNLAHARAIRASAAPTPMPSFAMEFLLAAHRGERLAEHLARKNVAAMVNVLVADLRRIGEHAARQVGEEEARGHTVAAAESRPHTAGLKVRSFPYRDRRMNNPTVVACANRRDQVQS